MSKRHGAVSSVLGVGVALLLAMGASGCTGSGQKAQASTEPSQAKGTKANLQTIAPLPGAEWTLPAGDYAHTRFSTLDQLKPSNVGKLKVVTTMTTGIPQGHEGGPLVVGHTMYVVTPFPNNLIAIDLTKPSGALKWLFEPHPDPRAVGIACCDVVNRGASYADGKIVYNLLDAHTVAVDAVTGKEVWRTRVGNIDIGETTTIAALVVKNKVLVGS